MAAQQPSLAFTRDVLVGDKCLEIQQSYIGDVGCVVWDSALVLTKFLENQDFFPKGFWISKYTIELGAGTGIVGLGAASLGADVVLTDLPELVELMDSNVQKNVKHFDIKPKALSLPWGQDISAFLPQPDVILLADLVYYEESIAKLSKTVLELCGPHTTVLMCYEEREIGDKGQLQEQFAKSLSRSISLTQVPYERLDEEMRSHDIEVFISKPRQE